MLELNLNGRHFEALNREAEKRGITIYQMNRFILDERYSK
ncbi:Uncharacterised protein [Klebsiella pneumoniae]|nr:Uncharacterised protein [Klebsiella pneumoniae]